LTVFAKVICTDDSLHASDDLSVVLLDRSATDVCIVQTSSSAHVLHVSWLKPTAGARSFPPPAHFPPLLAAVPRSAQPANLPGTVK